MCRCWLLQKQEVQLAGRPPIRWDVLSINVGITPDAAAVPGAGRHAVPIKPVSRCCMRGSMALHAAPAGAGGVSRGCQDQAQSLFARKPFPASAGARASARL